MSKYREGVPFVICKLQARLTPLGVPKFALSPKIFQLQAILLREGFLSYL